MVQSIQQAAVIPAIILKEGKSMKKVLPLLLMIAMMLTAIPFITAEASAATSDDSVTLVNTKTVTIKPGKTHKTPKFTTTEELAYFIPLDVKLAPKDKKKPKGYIKKGSLKITLKNAKKKSLETATQSLTGVDKGVEYWIDNWWCFYHEMEQPGFATGKYWFEFKNTTSRTIKVKYSIDGYREMASTATFPAAITLDEEKDFDDTPNVWAYKIEGKIGPGIPLVESVDLLDNDDYVMDIDGWFVKQDGTLYVRLYAEERAPVTATLSVKLANRAEPYKIKTTLTPIPYDDDDDDWGDDDGWDAWDDDK